MIKFNQCPNCNKPAKGGFGGGEYETLYKCVVGSVQIKTFIFFLICASVAVISCNRQNPFRPTDSEQTPMSEDKPPRASDKIDAESNPYGRFMLRDLQVLNLRRMEKEKLEAKEQHSRWEAASIDFSHLKVQIQLGAPEDVLEFAPLEWTEFSNAFETISSQINPDDFSRTVKAARYLRDHAVMEAKERKQLWANVQRARSEADQALSDVRQNAQFAHSAVEIELLEGDYSNTIATLRPACASEQQVTALVNDTAAAKKMAAMMSAISADFSHLKEQREDAVTLDVSKFAPFEWTKFNKAFENIQLQKGLLKFSTAVRTAQNDLDRSVAVAHERKLLWAKAQEARGDAQQALANIELNPLHARAKADFDPLKNDYSATVATLTPLDATPKYVSTFEHVTAEAKALLARMVTTASAFSHLEEQKGMAATADMEQFALVEWTEFNKTFAAISSQTNLGDFARAVTSAQDALYSTLAVVQDRKPQWAKVMEARWEANRALGNIQSSPLLPHAKTDFNALEGEYTNMVARLNPKDAAPRQVSEFAHITAAVRKLLARIEAMSGQSAILGQLKDNLHDEATALRQFAPARVKEAEQLLAEIENAKDLATYTNKLDRAILVITQAFDESDAARRGKR